MLKNNMKDPDKRAKELHSKIKDEFKKRKITISVGNSENDLSLIGTSERVMHKDVLDAMEGNDIVATPQEGKHAEEDIIAEAERLDLKISEIGSSRPICSDCEALIKNEAIEAKTPFSGKQSKKRRNKQ